MFPLATTELGTDSWIVDLMATEMNQMGLQAGWILVYTAAIMTIFRSAAGPLLRIFKPIGLLIFCSVVAAIGLFSLSLASGILIFVVATIYGFAKAYFWPTMMGIAGERFPKGGALTINMITAVGMIGVGIVGAVFLGLIQDTETDRKIQEFDQDKQTELHTEYVTVEKKSLFGNYLSLDTQKLESAHEDEKNIVSNIQLNAQKSALKTVAILPLIMLACFIILLLYFRSIGGYKSITLVKGKT